MYDEKHINTTDDEPKINPEDEQIIEFEPDSEDDLSLIMELPETPDAEPTNEDIPVEPSESETKKEKELSVEHQLAIKKEFDESLAPFIGYFSEIASYDPKINEEQIKQIESSDLENVKTIIDDMLDERNLDSLSPTDLNKIIESADSIKSKLDDISNANRTRLEELDSQIAPLIEKSGEYGANLAVLSGERLPAKILHRKERNEIQAKYDEITNILRPLQREYEKLDFQNLSISSTYDSLEIIQIRAQDAIEARTNDILEDIHEKYLGLKEQLMNSLEIKAELNEIYLQTKILPAIEKLKQRSKVEIPQSEIDRYIVLANEALNQGTMPKLDDPPEKELEIASRNIEIKNFYNLYDPNWVVSSQLHIPDSYYESDTRDAYDGIIDLLISNNECELMNSLSKKVVESNPNSDINSVVSSAVYDFTDSDNSPYSSYDAHGSNRPIPVDVSKIEDLSDYLDGLALLRWDTVKSYQGINNILGEGSFDRLENIIQFNTLSELITTREHTDESNDLGRRMLLFKNAEVAPYVIMNCWRESGHSGEYPFKSIHADTRQDTEVYKYITDLPESEIEKLKQMNMTVILEIIETVKNNPDNFDSYVIPDETKPGEYIKNPVNEFIEQKLAELAVDMINNGSENQQFFCMGLMERLKDCELSKGCCNKIAKILTSTNNEEFKTEIIKMTTRRYKDKELALSVLKNYSSYDSKLQEQIKKEAPELMDRFLEIDEEPKINPDTGEVIQDDPQMIVDAYNEFGSILNKEPAEIKKTFDFIKKFKEDYPNIIHYQSNISDIESFEKFSKLSTIPEVTSFIAELTKYGYSFNLGHANIMSEMIDKKDEIITAISEVQKVFPDYKYELDYIFETNKNSGVNEASYIYDPYELLMQNQNIAWGTCLSKLNDYQQENGEYSQKFTDGIMLRLRRQDNYVDKKDHKNVSEEEYKLFYKNFQIFSKAWIDNINDSMVNNRHVDEPNPTVLRLLARRPADVELAIEFQKNGQSLLQVGYDNYLVHLLMNEKFALSNVDDLNFAIEFQKLGIVSSEIKDIYMQYLHGLGNNEITRQNRYELFNQKYFSEMKQATGDDFNYFINLYIDAVRDGIVTVENRQERLNFRFLANLKNIVGDEFDSIINDYYSELSFNKSGSIDNLKNKFKKYEMFTQAKTLYSKERFDGVQKVIESRFGKAINDLITDDTEKSKILFDYACYGEHLEVNKQNFIISKIKEQSISDDELIKAFEYLRWLPDSDIKPDDSIELLAEKYENSQEKLRITFEKVFPNAESIIGNKGLVENVKNLSNGLTEICGILQLPTREVKLDGVSTELPIDFIRKFSETRRIMRQEGKPEPKFIPELVGYLVDQITKSSTAYTIEDLMYNQIGDTEDRTGRRRGKYNGEELLGAMEDNIEASLTTWFNAIKYQNEQPDSPLFVIANERTGPADVAAEFLPKEFAEEHKIFQEAQYDKFYDWFLDNVTLVATLYERYKKGEDVKGEIPAEVLPLLGIGPNKIIPIYQLKIPSSLSYASTEEPNGIETIVTFLKFVSIMGGRSMFMDESTRSAPRSIECLYKSLDRRFTDVGGVKMRVFGKIKDTKGQDGTILSDINPENHINPVKHHKMEICFIDPWPNPNVKSVTDDSRGFVPEINGSCGVIRVKTPSYTSVSPYGIGTLQSLWKQFIANEVSARYEGFKDSDQKKFKKEDFKSSRDETEEILSQDELKEKAFERPYKALIIDLDGTVSSKPEKYSPAIIERMKQLASDEVDVVIGTARSIIYHPEYSGSIKQFVEQLGELSDTQKSHIHFATENGASIATLTNLEAPHELKPLEEEVINNILPILSDVLNPEAKVYKEPSSLVIRDFTQDRKQEFIDKLKERISAQGIPVNVSSDSTHNIHIRVQNVTKRNIIEWLEKRGINMNDVAKIGDAPDGNDKFMLVGRGAFNVGKSHDGTLWTIHMDEHGGGPEETEKLLERLKFSK